MNVRKICGVVEMDPEISIRQRRSKYREMYIFEYSTMPMCGPPCVVTFSVNVNVYMDVNQIRDGAEMAPGIAICAALHTMGHFLLTLPFTRMLKRFATGRKWLHKYWFGNVTNYIGRCTFLNSLKCRCVAHHTMGHFLLTLMFTWALTRFATGRKWAREYRFVNVAKYREMRISEYSKISMWGPPCDVAFSVNINGYANVNKIRDGVDMAPDIDLEMAQIYRECTFPNSLKCRRAAHHAMEHLLLTLMFTWMLTRFATWRKWIREYWIGNVAKYRRLYIFEYPTMSMCGPPCDVTFSVNVNV